MKTRFQAIAAAALLSSVGALAFTGSVHARPSAIELNQNCAGCDSQQGTSRSAQRCWNGYVEVKRFPFYVGSETQRAYAQSAASQYVRKNGGVIAERAADILVLKKSAGGLPLRR